MKPTVEKSEIELAMNNGITHKDFISLGMNAAALERLDDLKDCKAAVWYHAWVAFLSTDQQGNVVVAYEGNVGMSSDTPISTKSEYVDLLKSIVETAIRDAAANGFKGAHGCSVSIRSISRL